MIALAHESPLTIFYLCQLEIGKHVAIRSTAESCSMTWHGRTVTWRARGALCFCPLTVIRVRGIRLAHASL